MSSRSRSTRRDPTVSVIVTNHDYSGFLTDCIESILGQTAPPDEIVVVDDGSADNSLALARRFGSRITVVAKPNGGQASAMNAGFARTSGDLVLFLDSDDLLRPEALETVLLHHHPDFSAYASLLEMIDTAGRSLGLYPASAAAVTGDNRRSLLARGVFAYPPTSGNVFRREAVAWVFPLPEARWRISADAVLLGAAALHGPTRAIPAVLGGYRVHRENSYFRQGAGRPFTNARGLADMADTLDLLAASPALPAADPKERRALKARLAMTAAVVRARRYSATGDRAGLIDDLTRASARARAAAPSLRGSAGWTLIGAAARSGRSVERIAGWLADPRTLPRAVRWMLSPDGASSRLDEPRRLARLRPGDELIAGESAGFRPVLAGGWIDETWGGFFSSGPDAALRFLIETEARPIGLTLSISLPAGRHRLSVRRNGRLADQVEAEDRVDLQLPLAASTDPVTDVRLDLSIAPAVAKGRIRGAFTPAGWFGLERLAVTDARPQAAILAPTALSEREAAANRPALAAVLPSAPDWAPAGDGGMTPTGSYARLSIDIAARPGPVDLVLSVGRRGFDGWARITTDGMTAFEGQFVENADIILPLPPGSGQARTIALGFDLEPLEPRRSEGAAWPSFAGIAVASASDEAEGRIRLNLGETRSLGLSAGRWVDPGADWTVVEDGLLATTSEALLRLALPDQPGERTLHLDLEPAIAAPDRRVVAGVSVDGAMRATADLDGGASLAVPVGIGPSTVVIHAVAVGPDGTDPAPAPVRLGRLSLSGTVADRPPATADVRWARPPLIQAAEAYAAAADAMALATDTAAMDRLCDARRSLADGIAGASGKTLRALVAADGWMGSLVRAWPAARLAPLSAAEAVHLDAAGGLWRSGAELDRLRAFLLVALHSTPRALGEPVELEDLPQAVVHRTAEVAAVLVREPATVTDEADVDAAVAAATRLYESAASAFAAGEAGDYRFRLAGAVLDGQRNLGVLFGSGSLAPMAAAMADAVERRLARAGHDLAGPPRTPRMRARLKVGILLYDVGPTPEGRLASGLAEALRRGPFDPVVVTLAGSGAGWRGAFEPPPVVDVTGLSTEDAVASIRALDLDVAVLGSYVSQANRAAEIVAHRLAPLQIAMAAVSPQPVGFRSVDAFLSAPMTEPATGSTGHHLEPLVLAADPFQCFDPLGWTATTDRMAARRRLGILDERVVLVSGAMWGKINDRLIAAWTAILAGVPGSVLVLYPFARNWKRSHAPARIRDRFADALRRQGLSPDRIVVEESLDAEGVRVCLAAADLYLDSFPYAGATTVVEALAARRPVVALAGTTQRGLQGAAWARSVGLEDLVADTPEAYVRIAISIAGSADRRADLEARLDAALAEVMPFADPDRFRAALEPVLLRLAAERGVAFRPDDDAARLDRGDEAVRFHVFHHLPKAAGTTCNAVFRSWFDLVRDYRPGWDDAETPPAQDLSTLTPAHMLAGHFDTDLLALENRYPEILEDRRCRMVTFFRDPVQTALSAHAFEDERRRHEPGYERISVDVFLARCGSVFLHHMRCGPDKWRDALDRYWFVGTVERLPDCLAWLARRLRKPLPDIPILNATDRAAPPSAAAVDDFVARNAIDYEILAEVNRRLDVLFTAAAERR
ncbi:glycosyltransferase [Chthonobacter rhizosphaerae]|uniref:glycosyltransferase n=1 Tax=Chthonobacter rhizosphaerae TaxID=2735553 RepID=UPI0015EEA439|nr:glycosyltransferase [Chthonobacter rhizosphaerae]